jgi:hypothetical protein
MRARAVAVSPVDECIGSCWIPRENAPQGVGVAAASPPDWACSARLPTDFLMTFAFCILHFAFAARNAPPKRHTPHP